MDGISVYSEDTRTTPVPNEFIDFYMPRANGTFVKVYLYLLRCLTKPEAGFGISSIADALEETEKDIVRALRYWEKERVLSLSFEQNSEIRGIKLHRLNKPSKEEAGTVITMEEAPKRKEAAHKLPEYTPEQIESFSDRTEVRFLLRAIEGYFECPLKPQDISVFLFVFDELHFSNELILHLYEYCVSLGKKSPSYIEKVAISWKEENVDSVEKAEAISIQYDACFAAVNRAFGLNRTPGIAERRFLYRWNSLGFSPEIIEEACNRTVLTISKPDFKYADKILSRWHDSRVTSLCDIRKLDETHAARSKKVTAQGQGVAVEATKFNNFTQRDYSSEDFSALESALLGRNVK